MHRSELAKNPGVQEWSSNELVESIDRLLAKTSVAESVAVLQIVPLPVFDLESDSGRADAISRLEDLAENCRGNIRAYDKVGIWNWSVVVIMWGVTDDGRLVHSVVDRILGTNLDSVGSPMAAVGAVIAQPGADAVDLVQATTKAVVEARSQPEPIVVVGSSPPRNATFDRLAGLEVALSPIRDFKRPDTNVMLARIMVGSVEGRRVDFFAHPGPSVVDRLLVAIEAVATLASQVRPTWEEMALEVPLSVLRASNTTPRVVESVMAEIAGPERFALLLTGPGDSNTLEEVQPILEPIRATGAAVLRVWEYDRRRFHSAASTGAALMRIGVETVGDFLAKESGAAALGLGPIRLAKKLHTSVVIDGGAHAGAIDLAESAGARFVMCDALGATQHLVLSPRPDIAA